MIGIRILNPFKLAVRETRVAGPAVKLAPQTIERIVYKRTVEILVEQLREHGVQAQLRIHHESRRVDWLLAALLLILLLAEIVAVGLVRRLYSRLDDVDQALRRTEARGREQALRLDLLDQLRNGQQLAEQMIGTGTTQTREVHQGVANIPFSILENIPSTAPAARIARKLHDNISNDIYTAIGTLNCGVGRQLRGGNDRDADRQRASSTPNIQGQTGSGNKPSGPN